MRRGKLIRDWVDGDLKEGEIITITSPPESDSYLEFMGCPIYHANSKKGNLRIPQSFVILES